MSSLQFPIDFTFKISTFSNDFTATDVNGRMIAYIRQKMFKLKEAIQIFTDESKSQVIYTISADKWIDFSAAYSFKNAAGEELGKVARKGWRSIWKASYEVIDQNQQLQYHITEENAWIKVLDSLLGEVPVLSMFTGYLFNPAYVVSNTSGEQVARLKKQPSLFGRKFRVEKKGEMDADDGQRVMLALMMMILLERRRG